eukprot:3053426-Pyramimonas_sp.AAC.1
MSAPTAVKIANAAAVDGLQHADVQAAARAGCGGLYPGNCWRDMLNNFHSPVTDRVIPPPHTVQVHLRAQSIRVLNGGGRTGIRSPAGPDQLRLKTTGWKGDGGREMSADRPSRQ